MDIAYGVQAVMYYSSNNSCEAEWFCKKCPFSETFCDKNLTDQSASKRLSEKAKEWLKNQGIDPYGEIPEQDLL